MAQIWNTLMLHHSKPYCSNTVVQLSTTFIKMVVMIRIKGAISISKTGVVCCQDSVWQPTSCDDTGRTIGWDTRAAAAFSFAWAVSCTAPAPCPVATRSEAFASFLSDFNAWLCILIIRSLLCYWQMKHKIDPKCSTMKKSCVHEPLKERFSEFLRFLRRWYLWPERLNALHESLTNFCKAQWATFWPARHGLDTRGIYRLDCENSHHTETHNTVKSACKGCPEWKKLAEGCRL